jgi:hypothetical protein
MAWDRLHLPGDGPASPELVLQALPRAWHEPRELVDLAAVQG